MKKIRRILFLSLIGCIFIGLIFAGISPDTVHGADNENSGQPDMAVIIDSAEVEITAPEEGQILPANAVCNMNGIATKTPAITWYGPDSNMPVSGAAAWHKDYMAVVTLVTETGYEFASKVTATVNGRFARVIVNEDGSITITCYFTHIQNKVSVDDNFISKDELSANSYGNYTDRKVYFGKNSQTWYIEGYDGNGIVLLCDPGKPLLTGRVFNSSIRAITDYSVIKGTYAGDKPSSVNTNHYGSSELRTLLNDIERDNGYFSAAEQQLMLNTTVYTYDTLNKTTYSTNDKLYAAYGDFHGDYNYDTYITVGQNSPDNLNGGIRVCLKCGPYMSAGSFWLRAPIGGTGILSLLADKDGYVKGNAVTNKYAVVPAFDLNPSSVLFLSATPAATSDATIKDVLTFRYVGDNVIKSNVSADSSSVVIDKNATDSSLYLYVQGDTWVYSKEITDSQTVSAATIGHGDLSAANIWIEQTIDNVTYAKMVVRKEDLIKAFVERLYNNVLDRPGDVEGINSWVKALLDETQSGATVSAGFVFSDEFINRNLTNGERVDIMYQTFLNRPADEDGKKMWTGALDSGVGIEKIYEGFVMSNEFAVICNSYGIAVGQMSDVPGLVEKLNLYRNRNLNVTGFVARCYTKALGRDKDIDGVEMWCRMIITKEWTPRNVALGFIHSDEFVNKNTTNEEYVSILYRTFLGRELDAPGAATWVGMLDRNEWTRDQVADGFADSDEFKGILAGFGLE